MKHEFYSKNTLEAKVFTRGTIKLPTALRNELHIHDGDHVLFIKKENTWIVTTHNTNIKNTQDFLKSLSHDKKNISLVDELIKERRRAAKEELK